MYNKLLNIMTGKAKNKKNEGKDKKAEENLIDLLGEDGAEG